MMDLQLNYRSSTGNTFQSAKKELSSDLPKHMEGLEIDGNLIGQGTHCTVVLGSYFLTPIAVKKYSD
jgi:hypothetical protein